MQENAKGQPMNSHMVEVNGCVAVFNNEVEIDTTPIMDVWILNYYQNRVKKEHHLS